MLNRIAKIAGLAAVILVFSPVGVAALMLLVKGLIEYVEWAAGMAKAILDFMHVRVEGGM